LLYSAVYTNQSRDQKHFSVCEMTAAWHEQTVPQRISHPLLVLMNNNPQRIASRSDVNRVRRYKAVLMIMAACHRISFLGLWNIVFC